MKHPTHNTTKEHSESVSTSSRNEGGLSSVSEAGDSMNSSDQLVALIQDLDDGQSPSLSPPLHSRSSGSSRGRGPLDQTLPYNTRKTPLEGRTPFAVQPPSPPSEAEAIERLLLDFVFSQQTPAPPNAPQRPSPHRTEAIEIVQDLPPLDDPDHISVDIEGSLDGHTPASPIHALRRPPSSATLDHPLTDAQALDDPPTHDESLGQRPSPSGLSVDIEWDELSAPAEEAAPSLALGRLAPSKTPEPSVGANSQAAAPTVAEPEPRQPKSEGQGPAQDARSFSPQLLSLLRHIEAARGLCLLTVRSLGPEPWSVWLAYEGKLVFGVSVYHKLFVPWSLLVRSEPASDALCDAMQRDFSLSARSLDALWALHARLQSSPPDRDSLCKMAVQGLMRVASFLASPSARVEVEPLPAPTQPLLCFSPAELLSSLAALYSAESPLKRERLEALRGISPRLWAVQGSASVPGWSIPCVFPAKSSMEVERVEALAQAALHLRASKLAPRCVVLACDEGDLWIALREGQHTFFLEVSPQRLGFALARVQALMGASA